MNLIFLLFGLIVPFQDENDVAASAVQTVPDVIPDLLYTDEDADIPCIICNEAFEKYWNDEHDDWMLKNALKIDGKVI